MPVAGPLARVPPTLFRPVDTLNRGAIGGAAALPLGTTWYVRIGGSNTNGGSSNSLTPDRSGIDAATPGSGTTITSATAAFTQADVGKGICIPNLPNGGYFKIIAVNSPTSITVDKNTNSGGTSGNSWSIGGAWASLSGSILNPARDTPLLSGDVVYIGGGTYRGTMSFATWTNGISFSGQASLIGDVDGSHTGDPGPVILTAYTTNDKTIPSATTLLNLLGRSNLSFQNIFFVGGAATLITASTLTSQNITFKNCGFLAGSTNTQGFVNATAAYDMPFNWIFDRCIFSGGGVGLNFVLNTGNGPDFDANVLIQNCIFNGTGIGQRVFTVTANGTLAGRGGGVRIRNCTAFIPSTSFLINNSTAVSIQIPCTVTGCLLFGGSGTTLSAATLGQIIEDYNLIVASVPRSNVAIGPHSISDGSYAPLIYFGQERIWNEMLRPLGEPMINSPLLQFGALDTSAGPEDARGMARPSSSLKWDVGAFQRDNNFTQEIITVHTGTNAISAIGMAAQDFDVAVDAGAITLSIYVQIDSNYAGPKPSLQVVNATQVSVGNSQVDASNNCINAWEQIRLTVVPNAAGIITVRLISRDTSGIGKCIFDSFGVA